MVGLADHFLHHLHRHLWIDPGQLAGGRRHLQGRQVALQLLELRGPLAQALRHQREIWCGLAAGFQQLEQAIAPRFLIPHVRHDLGTLQFALADPRGAGAGEVLHRLPHDLRRDHLAQDLAEHPFVEQVRAHLARQAPRRALLVAHATVVAVQRAAAALAGRNLQRLTANCASRQPDEQERAARRAPAVRVMGCSFLEHRLNPFKLFIAHHGRMAGHPYPLIARLVLARAPMRLVERFHAGVQLVLEHVADRILAPAPAAAQLPGFVQLQRDRLRPGAGQAQLEHLGRDRRLVRVELQPAALAFLDRRVPERNAPAREVALGRGLFLRSQRVARHLPRIHLVHRTVEHLRNEAGVCLVIDIGVQALQPRADLAQLGLALEQLHQVAREPRRRPGDEVIDVGRLAVGLCLLEIMPVASLPAAHAVVDEHLQHSGPQDRCARLALLDLGLDRYPFLARLAHPGVDNGALHEDLSLRRPARRDM